MPDHPDPTAPPEPDSASPVAGSHADASAGPGTGPPPPPGAAGPPPFVPGPGARHGPHRGRRWPLRRSIRDRKLKGVAAGVATAADVDVTLVRLLFVAAAFSGWGIVAYIVLAIVVQDETVDDQARPLPGDQRRMLRIGLAVAAVVAVGRLFNGPFTGGDIGLPLLLIAVGGAVLWARRDERPPESSPWPSPGPTSGPVDGGQAGWSGPGPDVPPAPWPPAPPPPPLGAWIDWRSTRHDLLRLAAAFAAVGAFLALLGASFLVAVGAVPMRLPFLPAAVAVGGLLALVLAVVRRARPAGLLVSGGVLVVAVALAVGLASFPGGTGTRLVTIGPDTPLLDRYDHSVGRLVLDLGNLRVPAGDSRRVVAKVGTGQLQVIVPPGLATDVRAGVGAGTTNLFGREQSGSGVNVDVRSSQAGAEGAGRLELDLDVGLGEIRVESVRLTTRLSPDAPPVLPSPPSATAPPSASPTSTPTATTLTTATTVPGPGASGPLSCGPPDAAGDRTCTTVPVAATSTTAPAAYRCHTDPASPQLICVPA